MEQLNYLTLPVIVLSNQFVYPSCETTIDIDETRQIGSSITAVRDYDSKVVIAYAKGNFADYINFDNIEKVAVTAKIRSVKKLENSREKFRVTLIAVERVKIESVSNSAMNDFVAYTNFVEAPSNELEMQVILPKVFEALKKFTANRDALWDKIPKSVINKLSKGTPPVEIPDIVAQYFPINIKYKIKILISDNLYSRFENILLGFEEEILKVELENRINQLVRKKIDDSQREYVLREKLKTIKEELGDVNDKDKDADEIRKIITENPYPESVKQKALDELRRFELMPSNSSEAMVIRTYIDWLLKTPWYQKSADEIDLKKVENILNANHFGLDKPKERIVEYLAVREFAKNDKTPIICFSGPPGIGKTSLAKSISEALNKKFVKISLGGVKDESEIRGHRRTYLGSLPGRIIQGMKKAGVTNPVFLLDEIDKMGMDYKGDPSAALLEVLDPEQNKFFSDHYLEEPYDLSNVLFVTTANYLENIPAALRDRLEIINLSSYTEIEKLNIAKNHLIPRQASENGLDAEKIKFSEDAILHIIRYYTREAGVRSLERSIGTVCRKIVVKILKSTTKKSKQYLVSIENVKDYLGKEKFDYTKKEKQDQIGVVTGLAYTEFGGDILPIEVTYFDGKGKLILTGSLGDIMKESASIALDYIRANSAKLNINPEIFEKIDIHVHAPEGAVPKDGPSAGVTMTTAIVSALTSRAVKSDIAMTGEITLRGNILAIGGLKEKSISAHRSGIKTIFVPKENERDLEDIPDTVKDNVKFIFTDNIDVILKEALVSINVATTN